MTAPNADPIREALTKAADAGYLICAESRHITLGDKVRTELLALAHRLSAPAPVEIVAWKVAKEIAASVVQSACETDPADAEHPDTILIGTDDLETIVRNAVENYAHPPTPTVAADEPTNEPVEGKAPWEILRDIVTPAPFPHNEQAWSIMLRLIGEKCFPATNEPAADQVEAVNWSASRGTANSHCMDDQLLADGRCVGFMCEDWTDRIIAALSQSPAVEERVAVVEPLSEALKVLRSTSAHEPSDADEMGQSITASNAADALQSHWLRVQFLWRALASPSGPEHAGQMADEMDALFAISRGEHKEGE